MGEVAEAIAALTEDQIAGLLHGATVDAAGTALGLEEVVVAREPRAGIVVATEERFSAALDTTLTPELEREGFARELARAVQGLRREAGLDVSDRIVLAWESDSDRVADAMAHHGDWIASEVLATELTHGGGAEPATVEVDGEAARFSLRVAG
jgi:isoleucyl-tRNA synthetase